MIDTYLAAKNFMLKILLKTNFILFWIEIYHYDKIPKYN